MYSEGFEESRQLLVVLERWYEICEKLDICLVASNRS